MSEVGKTSVYVVIALVLTGAAYLTRPKQETVTVGDRVDKQIFSDFDPNKVQGLRIVRYEEDLGEIHSFEVAKNARTGSWTIPSHSDYPADAEERVRDAATIFVGLKVLGVVTEDASEHALFGVLEPDKDKVKAGDKGVGLLVRFEGEKGKTQQLIIGKAIKGAEGHRFVRIAGQDPVYDVQIDPAKLSTKFEDWIKKDLLELNTWDVENVRIKDYSIVEAQDGTFLEPRFEVAVAWNSTDSKWKLDEFFNYKGREKTPAVTAGKRRTQQTETRRPEDRSGRSVDRRCTPEAERLGSQSARRRRVHEGHGNPDLPAVARLLSRIRPATINTKCWPPTAKCTSA